MGKTIQANLGKITHKFFGKEKPLDRIYIGLKGNVIVSSASFLCHFNNADLLNNTRATLYIRRIVQVKVVLKK